jgi:Fe-S cluster biogenesis protein NfuA
MGTVVMSDEDILQRINAVLDDLRPNIQMDGGDIEFVKFQNGVVYIRMRGACIGCPMSVYTLKMGIETALKERITEVYEVIALQDDELPDL